MQIDIDGQTQGQVQGQEERPRFQLRIPVPFLHQSVGAGDMVAGVTRAAGVEPCTPCQERKRRMNERLQFNPWNPWAT
jgi:hypothetical protein